MRMNEIESLCEAILDGEQSETTHLWKMPSLQFLIIDVSNLSCCPEHSAPPLCRGEGFLARSIRAKHAARPHFACIKIVTLNEAVIPIGSFALCLLL